DVTPQRLAHHLLFFGSTNRFEGARLTAKLAVKVRQRFFTVGIDKQTSRKIQKIVTGRSVDRPRLARFLAIRKNLLRNDPALAASRRKPSEIAERIAQTVRMIDSQACDVALGDPFPDQLMRGHEHLAVLHPKTSQCVDIEEPAIAKVSRCHPPVR